MPDCGDALPYLSSDLPPVPGRLRVEPEDFLVDEALAYAPAGTGEHLFVRFRKRGLTTPEAVRRIAAALGVEWRNAGWAGLKDRHAVTTQWASFPAVPPERVDRVELEDVEIIEAVPHPHKLRTGHLRANRFVLRVREAAPHLETVRRVLELLQRSGVPNYFGEQRFGRDGSNVPRARRWLLEGGPPPKGRFERKMLVSALQSWLFNAYLADRIRDGRFGSPIPGDLLRKEDTGGMFTTDDLDEATRRMAAWEVSPTGPMYGPRMRWPEGEARARERALLDREGIAGADLARFGRPGEGTRRPIRVLPADVDLAVDGDALRVAFQLPGGAYATAVMREVLKGGGDGTSGQTRERAPGGNPQ